MKMPPHPAPPPQGGRVREGVKIVLEINKPNMMGS